MDAKCQLLLRRYIETRDPYDAVAFANAICRCGDAQEIKVWVVYSKHDRAIAFTLHDSEEKAYEHAAGMLPNILNSELGGQTYEEVLEDPEIEELGLEEWIQNIGQIQDALLHGSYVEAVELYQEGPMSNYLIQVYTVEVH